MHLPAPSSGQRDRTAFEGAAEQLRVDDFGFKSHKISVFFRGLASRPQLCSQSGPFRVS